MCEHLPIICPHCGQRTLVDAASVGAIRKCLRCGKILVIPAAATGSAAGSAVVAAHLPPGSIVVTCSCGRMYRATAQSGARHGTCPVCGAEIVVPGSPSAAVPTPALVATGARIPVIASGSVHEVPEEDDESESAAQASGLRAVVWVAIAFGLLLLVGIAFLLGHLTGESKPPAPAPNLNQPLQPAAEQSSAVAPSGAATFAPPQASQPAGIARPIRATAGAVAGSAASRPSTVVQTLTSRPSTIARASFAPSVSAAAEPPRQPPQSPPPEIAHKAANESSAGKELTANAPAQPTADLKTLSRRLTSEVTRLIEDGRYSEAAIALQTVDGDLRRFASTMGLPLWDNSIAPLFRLAERKQIACVLKGHGSRENPVPQASRPVAKLSGPQLRELAALRTGLGEVTPLIAGSKLNEAQEAIDKAQFEARKIITAAGVEEWHLAAATVFQLAARKQSELDQKRNGGRFVQAVSAVEKAEDKPATPACSLLTAGPPAPAFSAMLLDGKAFDLRQYRGKWILLDFWATWCGPCRAEMSNLKEVFDTFGKDPQFVMISLSMDNQVEDVQQYVTQNGLKWMHAFIGPGSTASKLYKILGIPAIFLISPEGRIAAIGIRGADIKAAVSAALQQGKSAS